MTRLTSAPAFPATAAADNSSNAVGLADADRAAPTRSVGSAPTMNSITTDSAMPAAPISRSGIRSLTKVPDLLHEWHQSTVEAHIEHVAIGTFAHEIDLALTTAEAQVGRKLERPEVRYIRKQVIEANLPAAMAMVRPSMDGTDQKRDATFQAALTEMRPVVAGKFDPFTPVAQNDPQARAKETVLWENANVMVLTDPRSPSPKALVIPKTQVSLPNDASAATIKELQAVAAALGDAFADVFKSGKGADVWINPPHYLMVKQLHVHVQPNLQEWEKQVGDESKIPARKVQMNAQVSHALARLLGPSS